MPYRARSGWSPPRAQRGERGVETLIDLLRTGSERYGQKIALSIRAGLRDDTWSYRRLWQAANAVASCLHDDFAVAPGARIVVWAPNSPQLVATYFGAMLAGVVLVPLDPYSTPQFILATAERTDAAAIISGFPAPLGSTQRIVRLADLAFDVPSLFSGQRPNPEDTAEIVFTSGTTGNPKGVCLSHANIVANVKAGTSIIPPDSAYRLLSVLPLSHMFEQTAGLYLPLLYGNTVFYPSNRQSSTLLKMLQRYHIVTMVVVPQLLSMFLNGIEREVERQGKRQQWARTHQVAEWLPPQGRRWLFRSVHQRLGGSLEFFLCGGAALPPELQSAWERMGISVVQGYGATECAPVIASNTLRSRRPGSVGRALPGVEVKLSGENEILVRGPSVARGYWLDRQGSRSAVLEDGWYRTGDLARMDDQGYLFLAGRLKDLIVLASGLKVDPEDVEAALHEEPGIADCAVVGRLDRSKVTHVHAVLVPVPVAGEDEPTRHKRLSEAVRKANLQLAPHQQVVDFSIWDNGELPRTHLQKLKRHEVLAVLEGRTPPALPTPSVAPIERGGLGRIQLVLAEASGFRPESITPESDLVLDLHLDSLRRVELAVSLEEELGISLEDADLATAHRVSDLLALIRQSERNPAPVQFASWPLGTGARVARTVLQRLLVLPALGCLCRPFKVEGREHLEQIQLPVLLIANHTSHLDTPSILRALPARVRGRVAVAAAADYFYRVQLEGDLMSLALNTFPFSREGAVRSSLEHCGELADGGWSILLYPEGTRSPTGGMHPFKSGVGLLATELGLPVVPIAVLGTHAVLPKGSFLPRPGPVTVRIGVPMCLPPSRDHAATAALLERAVATLSQAAGTS